MNSSATSAVPQSIPTPTEIRKQFPQLAPLVPETGEEWYAGRGNPVVHLLNRWEWHQTAILALFRKTVDDPDPDSCWGAYHALNNHAELLKAIQGVAEKYPTGTGAERGALPVTGDLEQGEENIRSPRNGPETAPQPEAQEVCHV
jgi:hypothetical protein